MISCREARYIPMLMNMVAVIRPRKSNQSSLYLTAMIWTQGCASATKSCAIKSNAYAPLFERRGAVAATRKEVANRRWIPPRSSLDEM